MNATEIAKGLPKARKMGGSWWACCPAHDDHDPSLKIDQSRDGRVLVKCWAGCSQVAVIDALRSRELWDGAQRENVARRSATPPSPIREDDTARTARARVLWREARDPRRTIVETYLASRGLNLPADVHQADALRFHPSCPFKLKDKDKSTVRMPAMVALMVDITSNAPTGIHRTALKPDGSGKAEMPDGTNPKKMYGPAKGAVVKLCADDTVTDGLGITEGIEDGLTIVGAGWRPVWAALSAGAIPGFPVLAGVEALTIFADADPTGLAAAQQCQARWRAAGRECPILLPPHDGTDWNAWRAA